MPLKVSDGMGAWIKDFQKSDAPQFKGKSDKDRRDQAIAAYLSAKRGDKQEGYMPNYADKMKKKMMTPSDKDKLLKIKQMLDKEKNQKQENVKSADKKPEVYTKPDGKKGVRMVPTDREVVEKVYSKPAKLDSSIARDPKVKAAQKAHAKGDWNGNVDKEGNAVVHVKGKPHTVTVQTEDASSDAVKAYMAKGGKVTKLPPAKAQGYHGKDDPGKGMHGVMDKGDTKQLPRKKVRSLGASTEATNYKVQVTGPDHAGVHSVKAKSQDHAHQMVMKKIGQSKLPRHMQPKTRIMGESVDELSMYTSKKLPNLSYPKKKTKHEKERDRLAMMRKNKQKGESARDDRLAALKKQHDRQKKQDDANLSKLRYARGMKEEMSFAVSIEGLPQMFISADSPGMLKQTLRKIVKQPSMIQSVKRVTDAQVKKTFRLKAQGREEEDQE